MKRINCTSQHHSKFVASNHQSYWWEKNTKKNRSSQLTIIIPKCATSNHYSLFNINH